MILGEVCFRKFVSIKKIYFKNWIGSSQSTYRPTWPNNNLPYPYPLDTMPGNQMITPN